MYTGSENSAGEPSCKEKQTQAEAHAGHGRELEAGSARLTLGTTHGSRQLRPAVSTGALPGAPHIAGAKATLPSN